MWFIKSVVEVDYTDVEFLVPPPRPQVQGVRGPLDREQPTMSEPYCKMDSQTGKEKLRLRMILLFSFVIRVSFFRHNKGSKKTGYNL